MLANVVLAGLSASAALISGRTALLSWQRRETTGACAFSLFSACVAVWSFFSIFELTLLADGLRVTLARFQYFGIAYFPVFWLIFTLQYTHQDARLQPILKALLILPTLNLLMALTDPWHGLIWNNVILGSASDNANIIFKIEHGWWFKYILAPHQYFLCGVGICVLIRAFFVNSALYRRQILFLLASAWLPLMVNVPYIFGNVSFKGIDLTPIGLALSGILIQFGLFKGRIFDLSPISYRSVFLNLSEAVILLDQRFQIVDLNPSAYQETPYAGKPLVGRLFQSAFPDYQDLTIEAPVQELTRTIATNIKGTPQTKEVKIRLLRSPGGQSVGWAIMIRDITLQYQQQHELQRIAYLDALTGVGNRRQLEVTTRKMFAPEAQSHWPIALIYLDLDTFKPINDAYGHDVGDLLLKHTARCLQTSVRSGDLVVRLGGDEFVVLLCRADRSAAEETSRRIRAHLQKPVKCQGHILQVDTSIGIACFPQDGQTLKDMLRSADQEMYRQKQASRAKAQQRL
jgi:diguanylate cyclase (GGDEF)-like protein/PAS domain S-box-containing protein